MNSPIILAIVLPTLCIGCNIVTIGVICVTFCDCKCYLRYPYIYINCEGYCFDCTNQNNNFENLNNTKCCNYCCPSNLIYPTAEIEINPVNNVEITPVNSTEMIMITDKYENGVCIIIPSSLEIPSSLPGFYSNLDKFYSNLDEIYTNLDEIHSNMQNNQLNLQTDFTDLPQALII